MKKIRRISNKGFSLVELIVTIAIIGILVTLATPKFMGYVEKSELARIKNDVKIMEDKMSQKMINSNKEYLSWENNSKELGKLAMANMLFETKGLARGVVKPKTNRYGDTASGVMLLSEEEVEHKDYKIVPDTVVKEIKSKLSGTFYSNIDGKVYYEHGKQLTNAKEDIVLGCEAPEPLDYDFDEIAGTILKYHGNLQHLVIPSAFKVGELCYPVRIIGRGAFMRGNYGGVEQRPIKTVVIPSSVEKIEEDAFKDNDIENVTIPPSVTDIGDNAFAGNNLVDPGNNGGSGDGENSGGTGVENSNSVIIQSTSGGGFGGAGGSNINISSSAFSNNGPLGSPTIIPQYRPVTDKDLSVSVDVTINELGYKVGTVTDYDGIETSVIIPAIIIVDGEEIVVEEIGKGAYQGKGLISVQFPDGLKRIEDYAFAGNQLVGVTIQTSVEHIGDYAFGFNEVKLKNMSQATIRNINIFRKDRISDLDKNGNIVNNGNKVNKLEKEDKAVNLLDYIFITSKSNVVINVNGDNVEGSSKGYTNEEIQLLIDNEGYIPISTSKELQGIKNNLSGKYIQVANIDMFDIDDFEPIGTISKEFEGIYNGGNFKIIDLNIFMDSGDFLGLFGAIKGASIKNTNMIKVDIRGMDYVSGLVGYVNQSEILNSSVSGNIKGRSSVGGLVGNISSNSKITKSSTVVNIEGDIFTGGLVGGIASSQISDSYSSGNVKGNNFVGGFVGSSEKSSIKKSSFSGTVKGTGNTGGFTGRSYTNSVISQSYAVGSVSGEYSVGGFTGHNHSSSINNSYFIGSIKNIQSIHTAWFAGVNNGRGGNISNSYSTGELEGGNSFVGSSQFSTTTNSYSPPSKMKKESTYNDWDFDTIWQINEGEYPTLRWQN